MTDRKEYGQTTDILREARVFAFDWDGTIVDSVPYKLAQNQALAREFGHELTAEEVRRHWIESAGFNDLMQRLCRTDDTAAIMEVVGRDYNKPEFAKRPFEFAPRLLGTVREMGKQAALVTNVTRQLLRTDAESVGLTPLDDYFDYIQTADESAYKKPDPRVFDPLLQAFDAEPGQVVYIGDEINDLRAARDAGINFIGVESGMTSRDEFMAEKIRSIRTLGELSFRAVHRTDR